MSAYREFQFGSFIIGALVFFIILNTYLFFYGIGNNPMGPNQYIFSSGIPLLIILFFYGLTTRVDDQRIVVSFGIGLFRKRIDLDRINQVSIVKNPWFFGWGYRFIPGGILLNITGFDAIEIGFKDSERIVRIGTSDPVQLRAEILQRLPKRAVVDMD